MLFLQVKVIQEQGHGHGYHAAPAPVYHAPAPAPVKVVCVFEKLKKIKIAHLTIPEEKTLKHVVVTG